MCQCNEDSFCLYHYNEMLDELDNQQVLIGTHIFSSMSDKAHNYECPFCLNDCYINPDVFTQDAKGILGGKFMYQCSNCGSLDYIKKTDLKKLW